MYSIHFLRKRTSPVLLCAALLCAAPHLLAAQSYFPGRHPDWERRAPEELGLDAAAIRRAVEIAIAGESPSPRDLAFNHLRSFGREPLGDAVGPFTTRAPQTGLIVYKGYIVAEWGDPAKSDNTFSVSKSFLSTTVGLAYDHGLIRGVHDPVRDYMPPIVLDTGDGEPGDEHGRRPKLLFESRHNRGITWNHLLRQTSDWEGTLWGKPEWADRPGDPAEWGTRPRNEPGTVYEYNDTRVNLLALAATAVWRRPLPEVLREYVMDPIGASTTWAWHGYENSWVNIDGRMIQSPSGGRALGRRHDPERVRPGPFRPLHPAPRRVERKAAALGGLVRDGHHRRRGERRLRLHELRAEPQSARHLDARRRGREPDLRRSRQRPGDRVPVDPGGRVQRGGGDGAGGGGGELRRSPGIRFSCSRFFPSWRSGRRPDPTSGYLTSGGRRLTTTVGTSSSSCST